MQSQQSESTKTANKALDKLRKQLDSKWSNQLRFLLERIWRTEKLLCI